VTLGASFVLAAAAAAPMPIDEVDYLVETFRSACMRGSATFKVGEVQKIAWKNLDPNVNWYYGYEKSQQIYKLNRSQAAYLITFDQKPGGYYYSKVCAVVARGLPFLSTWERVLKVRFTEDASRKLVTNGRTDFIELPVPEEGMKLSIRRLWGPFVTLQASTMSKAETREWSNSRAIKASPIPRERK
jgi:hypothetical protein